MMVLLLILKTRQGGFRQLNAQKPVKQKKPLRRVTRRMKLSILPLKRLYTNRSLGYI